MVIECYNLISVALHWLLLPIYQISFRVLLKAAGTISSFIFVVLTRHRLTWSQFCAIKP